MSPPPTTIASATTFANQSLSCWAPYRPTDSAPWDLRRVVHLHRRAGFAANWTEIQRDLQAGPAAAIDRLLNADSTIDTSDEFEQLAQTIGDAAMASGNPGRLKAWWLYRMLMSTDPLGERLTLMWHNHFATSNRKVDNLVLMREQNDLFRQYARAPFGVLLEKVVKHPAMLVWLDADSNRRGRPNENLARELMELFTLGIDNYSEADVKQAARALTGWTIIDGRFGFREARHDNGTKTIISKRAAMNGDELVTLLRDHPATARRLAWRICRTLMGENAVDATSLGQLADGLSAHRLDIDWAVATVLRSQRFFADQNMGARVIGPVEYVVGTLRSLERIESPPSTLVLAEWAARMGQDLFYPPNVGGWNEGLAWLGSRNVIARANFADALVQGRLWHPTSLPKLATLVRKHAGDCSLADGAMWLAKLFWGHAPAGISQAVATRAAENQFPDPMSSVVAQLLARPEHSLA